MRSAITIAAVGLLALAPTAQGAPVESIPVGHTTIYHCAGKFGRATIGVKVDGKLRDMRVVPDRQSFTVYRYGPHEARVHTTPAGHQQRIQNWSSRTIFVSLRCASDNGLRR